MSGSWAITWNRPIGDELRDMMALATDPGSGRVSTPQLYTHRTSGPIASRDKALGGVPLGEPPRRDDVYKPGSRAAQDVLDPALRLLDMDDEGIDVGVIFPSALIGFSALDDPTLEAALYRAYNSFMVDFCAAEPSRLKFVPVVSMRDIEDGVAEVRRMERHAMAVGLYTQTHMDGRQLDDPFFHPLWEAAQHAGMAIACHHGSAGLPPWGLGVFEMGDNWFQQHASVFVYEQMRAVATVIGGGLLERFPSLTFAFLESGCGWLPYWLERLDSHYKRMPKHVPLLSRTPSEAFAGGRCFISFDPDEVMLADVAEVLGEEWLVYASDYPHFDCKFPDTVSMVVERQGLSERAKGRLLSENAPRLYPRLA